MTYENFLKVILQLQKQEQVVNNLYKNNVDLLEFVDPYHQMISTLIEEIYGKEGLDWWSWFIYESDYGTKDWSKTAVYEKKEDGTMEIVKEAGEVRWGATDENGNPICYSFESLWEFLESLRTKP